VAVVYVFSRVIFWGGVATLGYLLVGDVIDDERMKWALALPAAYLLGVFFLGD
jgi:hypothetical protein